MQARKKTAALERLEHRFDSLTPTPAPLAAAEISVEVCRRLLGGDRIGAILQYRTETGAGLKEAKSFIEGLSVATEKQKTGN